MFLVLIIAFLTLRMSGSPIEIMFPDGITEEHQLALEEKWDLHLPLHEQFAIYMKQVVQGDFGISIYTRQPVVEMYWDRFPPTLAVGGLAFLISALIGIPLGLIAALKRNSTFDRVCTSFLFFSYAIPNFVVGIILILIFGYHLKLLPVTGLDSWQNYILPVTALAIPMIATNARYMRSSMLDTINKDYVMTASLKGVPDSKISKNHLLRNAMLPVITVLGLEVTSIVNGSIFIEVVFSLLGVGRVLIGAVADRDFAVLQFGVVAYCAIIIVVNLLIDLIYGIVDPRIQVEG